MNVRQFAWLLLIVGVLLIVNLPVQYYQTSGFPTYESQESVVNQVVHIINGTVEPDSRLSVNVTFHQDEFSSYDRLLYDTATGGHPLIHFLEGYVTVRFNLTEEGRLSSENDIGFGYGSFFASSPNGVSLGDLGVDAKPGTYYLVTPFYDQTPGGGDFQLSISVDEYVTKTNLSLLPTIELSIVGAALMAISGYVLVGFKRATFLILLPLLIIALAYVNFTAPPTPPKQYPLVYIRPDGAIQGSNGIITHDNTTYSLVNDINASLIVQKDNTVIDGADHTIQGPGNGTGIDLTDRNNVTVTNTNIKDFEAGIHLQNSTGCNINNNLILNNTNGIEALEYSTGNTISNNNISSNGRCGIYLWYASNNKILDNYFSGNAYSSFGAAVELNWYSDNNKIVRNSVFQNTVGVYLWGSTNETVIHNNFDNNIYYQFEYSGYFLPNNLDNGYPEGGNYWSDYTGQDNYQGIGQNVTGSDGIGDTPYRAVPSDSNVDMYPLMNPIGLNETYTLTILPANDGSTSLAPRTYAHLQNAQINVTAQPDSGYLFGHWLLNGQNATSQENITIILNANYTLQPVFFYAQPPTMGQCTQNPPADNVQPNQNVTVSQIITVNDGEEPPQYAYLGYSTTGPNGTEWTFDYLKFDNATEAWEGTIPGQPAGTQVAYETQAYTSAGSYVINDNNGQYYTYTVK